MNQISSLWNNFRSKFRGLLENSSDFSDRRVISIKKFILKELNQSHKKKNHKINNLVFIRNSQLNIGSIMCEYCFQQNKDWMNFQYSLDIIKILEDVFNFMDQVSSCFQNDLQLLEERPYHQLQIFDVMRETFDNKSIKKDIIWKINTCILKIETYMFFTNEQSQEYQGKSHYNKINIAQMNKVVQNIKATQIKIHQYRQYIKLMPKVLYLKKFHLQYDYIYQQTFSIQFIAILVTSQIIIYNINSGIRFDTINVDYQNNKIIYFQFTKDENYLIFVQDQPYCLLIFNMKERKLTKIQDLCISSIDCIYQQSQNYLVLYDSNLTFVNYIDLKQSNHNTFRISKRFTYDCNSIQIQVFTFYDSIENRWKNLIKNKNGSINILKQQITRKFKLHFVKASGMIRLYYSLIQNQNKKIRRISSLNQFEKNIYFISQDESFIVSSNLSFYQISTGKIAFEIRLDQNEELQDVKCNGDQINILTWDNLFIYDLIKQKE